MKKKSIFTLFVLLVLASCGKKEEQQMPAPAAAPFPVQTISTEDAVVYQEFTANF